MTTTTTPVMLSTGQTSQVPLPASGQVNWCVLANLSPFLLAVAIGSDTFWQPPWSADKYDLTRAGSSPIRVGANQTSGTFPPGGSQEVTATWYFQGETPQGVYPQSLVANALAASISGGSITLSGQVPVINGTPSPLQVGTTPNLASSPASGQATIASSGTAAQLPNLPATLGVWVSARKANAAAVFLGPSGVTTANGFELDPGVSVYLPVSNANRLWVNGNSPDGVTALVL